MNNSISFNSSKKLNSISSKLGKITYKTDLNVSIKITNPIKDIIVTKMYDKNLPSVKPDFS